MSTDERIGSLDVLRGFAVLGILVMNIQAFSMIGIAYFNPTAHMDLGGANRVVWFLSHVLTDQKFMAIFSMLFGAGICLMSRRAEVAGRSAAGIHYRRMGWLILFGLLHAHLLWHGDVLYTYGMCGLVVFLFRKLKPAWLIVLGLLALGFSSALWLFFQWSIPFWPEEQLQQFIHDWRPDAETISQLVNVYQGGWLEQMSERVPSALEMQIFVFFIWGAWRAGGMMLIGMALFKLEVLGAGRPARLYAVLVVAGLLVGLPLVLYGVHWNSSHGWDALYGFFGGTQFNYWGSIAVSLAWIGLVLLICKAGRPAWLLHRLAAVGRMAFSLYILQTLICTTVFYGHGLGLFGRVERIGQIAIVAAVCILQLVLAQIWLSRFRFGPLEWLWRTLTYRSRQPMRL